MHRSSFISTLAVFLTLSAPATAQPGPSEPTEVLKVEPEPPSEPTPSEPTPSEPTPSEPTPSESAPSLLAAEPEGMPVPPGSTVTQVAEPRAVAPAASIEESKVAEVAPPASSWSPVYTASYFTRYEMRSGYQDLGVQRPRFEDGDAIFYRLRLGLGTGLIDTGSRVKVGLQATPQATGIMGTLPNTLSDAVFGLHEGYLRAQGDFVRADLGRFELNYGEALVIGNLDWHETGRSFDGARARFAASPDSFWVDTFATLVREGRTQAGTFADGDVYFLGAYAALGPAIAKGMDLDAYALARVWPESSDLVLDRSSPTPTVYDRKRAGEGTLGVRAKQKLGMIDYRTEAGLQVGSRPDAAPTALPMGGKLTQTVSDVLAYHADLEVGISLVAEKLRLAGELLYASGNDPDTSKNEGWDELYPTAHKWVGLSDAFALNGSKRTNVAGGVMHVTTRPFQGFTLQCDGHFLVRPQKVNGRSGFAAIEIDVGASYQIVKGLVLRGLYALFIPDSGLYGAVPTATSTDAAQFGEVELRYDL